MTIFPALKQKETIRNKIERQKMNKQSDKQKIVCLVQRSGARVTNNIH